MDTLKAILEAKKKAAGQDFGNKKYVKRSELEDLRLKRLRGDEEAERRAKANAKAARVEVDSPGPHRGQRPSSRAESDTAPSPTTAAAGNPKPAVAEVIRRLRRIREPATLFGESEEERRARLKAAEANVKIVDEDAGGQQANLHIELEREARQRARQRATEAAATDSRGGGLGGKAAANGGDEEAAGAPAREDSERVPGISRPIGGSEANGREHGDGTTVGTASSQTMGHASPERGSAPDMDDAPARPTPADPEAARLEAAFRAAAAVAAEAALPVPDRVARRLRGWMADWERDLASRSVEAAESPEGQRASVRFEETKQYMRPLYDRLASRELEKEVLAAILLITDAIRDRNYLHAYKIYMGLAIGNAAWPIGVTQVGLHDRSAREKISFKFNASAAHIMNDEAMRKFIQALKRLMTFCQRRYPTEPSRSVDFDGAGGGSARGTAGGGSDRLALLEAVASGDAIAPAPAPTHLDSSGSVKIPPRWEHQIRAAIKEVERNG